MEQMLYAKLLRSYDPKYVVDEKLDIEGSQRARKSQVSRHFPRSFTVVANTDVSES